MDGIVQGWIAIAVVDVKVHVGYWGVLVWWDYSLHVVSEVLNMVGYISLIFKSNMNAYLK